MQEKIKDDTISRQAAMDTLRMDISIIPFAKAREYVRATIEEIYNRLEELPSAQPVARDINVPTNNCINRQEAIDQLHQSYNLFDAERRLEDLPSSQPDNDMIRLQKEQAYLQGWEEGREALRKEQRWIPCMVVNQNFIPELKDSSYAPFLFTYETSTGKKRVRETWIDHGRIVGKKMNGKPIAYKHMPEPYREEGD